MTQSAEKAHGHAIVPANAQDGDRFTCARCGYSAEFVVLNDGLPGEWVDTTPHVNETIVYRYRVTYTDGAGDEQADLFQTRDEAERRVRYLDARGRDSHLSQACR